MRGRRIFEPEHKINDRISAAEVRLVGENVEVGVYSREKALKLAQDLEADLVEISPNAVPPVCRIIDYRKFLYDQKKKQKEMKAARNAFEKNKWMKRAKDFSEANNDLMSTFKDIEKKIEK